METQVNVSQYAMNVDSNRPTILTLVGLTGLLCDGTETGDSLIALGTSMTLPAEGFHTRRYQSARNAGMRGMRRASRI